MTSLTYAQLVQAFPNVANAADRAVRFASPGTYQKIFRLDTGDVEQWDGVTWNVIIPGGLPQRLLEGTGSPEGVVTASVSAIYQQTDGANGVVTWVKNSGTGNTGWRQVQAGLPNTVTVYADAFAGATADVKIQAAHDALPSTGGVVDARGLTGAQTITAPLTLTKPCVLLLGATTFTANAGFAVVTGNNVTIQGMGGGASHLVASVAWSATDFYMIDVQGVSGYRRYGVSSDIEATGAYVAADTYILDQLIRDDLTHAVGSTDFRVEACSITVHGTDPATTNKKYGILCWTRTATPPRLTGGGSITGNYIYATGGRCIELALCENVAITGNVIVQGGGSDTLVCVGTRVIGSRNITVSDNVVDVTGTSLVNADCLQVNGDNLNENVVFSGNACRTSVAGGTGIKVGSNATNIVVAGNVVEYVGTATSGVQGIAVTNSIGGAIEPTKVLVVGNRVQGFVNQLAVQRFSGGDPFPFDVTFAANSLGLRWDGTDSLVTFFNISSADPVAQRLWFVNNHTDTLTGVVGLDERFQGVVASPGIQGGLTNPALSGEFRTPSTGQFKFRNNANTADIIGLSKTTGDFVQLGASGAVETQLLSNATVIARARQAATALSPGATATFDLGEAALLWRDLNLSRKSNVPRYFGTGTAHVAGDYALSAGWGTTATVSTVAARDTGGRVSITCNGASIAANPTVTLTWKDGTWTTAPAVVCSRSDLVMPIGPFLVTTPGATTCVFTFNGLPVAGSIYTFDFLVTGK